MTEATESTSLIEAFLDRYRPDPDTAEVTEGVTQIEVGENVKFEFVGYRQARDRFLRFDNLKHVSLSGKSIDRVGLAPDASFQAHNVEELDLSWNSLSNWEDLLQFAHRLPRLRTLQLSSNPLRDPPAEPLGFQIPSLRILVLNKTSISWTEVQRLEGYFPNLEELHLCFNGISSLSPPSTNSFQNLKLLHLEGNSLSEWSQVAQSIGFLPKLQTLSLNSNPIASITSQAGDVKPFQALRSLSLARTQIHSWKTLDVLRDEFNLEELRLQDVPLTKELPSMLVSRNLIIARLPQLRKLNGSEITAKERTEAEIFYLRSCSTLTEQQQKDDHPMYELLLEKHPNALKVSTTSTAKNDLLPVALRCKGIGDEKTFDKTLPASTTIGMVKNLAAQLCSIPVSQLQLKHEDEVQEDDEATLFGFQRLFLSFEVTRK